MVPRTPAYCAGTSNVTARAEREAIKCGSRARRGMAIVPLPDARQLGRIVGMHPHTATVKPPPDQERGSKDVLHRARGDAGGPLVPLRGVHGTVLGTPSHLACTQATRVTPDDESVAPNLAEQGVLTAQLLQ